MKKEIYNPDRSAKIEITLRNDGLFNVQLYKLVQEVVPEFEFESDYFWEPISRPSITDTYENAEKLAMEELSAWAGDLSLFCQ